MKKEIQAKHLPIRAVIDAITSTRGRNGVERWATTHDVLDALSSFPPKVVMTKLRSLVRRGIIGGHACSISPPYCRGDFELVEGAIVDTTCTEVVGATLTKGLSN